VKVKVEDGGLDEGQDGCWCVGSEWDLVGL
jgi:hypothetical protein